MAAVAGGALAAFSVFSALCAAQVIQGSHGSQANQANQANHGAPQRPAPPANAQGAEAAPSTTSTISATSATAQVQPPTAAQGGTVHGTVIAGAAGKAGSVPLPGVAITATNTLTGRKYATATDGEGAYTLLIARNGRYVIRAELAGFAPSTVEVVVSAAPSSAAAAPLTTASPGTAAGSAPAGGVTPSLNTAQSSNFSLELASRVAAEAAQTAQTATTSLGRGLQNLSLAAGGADAEVSSPGAGNAGATLPNLGALNDSVTGETAGNASESIAVSGQTGQTNGLANFSEDELRQRVQDGVAQARASGLLPGGGDPTEAIVGILGPLIAGGGGGGGGFGGGGGGGVRGGRGGGGGGGGGFRNFNPTQLHGGINYTGEFSALDSAPWSVTLQPGTRQSYLRNSFGASLVGSPYVPGLIKPSTKQFVFLNFNGQRNTNPEVLNATVPTLAQRAGDFSGLTQTVNGGLAQPTPIYDPLNPSQQLSYNGRANVIDPARLSPQARAVLNYYPAPNITAVGTGGYNYQTVTTAGQNSANLAARYTRSFGANAGSPFGGGGFGGGGGRRGGGATNANGKPVLRQSLNSTFNYSHAASDVRNVFLPLGGANLSDGYNLSAGYTISYGRVTNNSSLTWNRSHGETRNYFTDTALNPSTQTGIARPSNGAIGYRPNFYNGLPTLSLTNFTPLTNTNPSDTVGQTVSFSDFVSWRHKKHNMRFGLDLRRVHQDSLGGNNPLGTFVFTGYATESQADRDRTNTPCTPNATTNCNSTAQASSGAAFADFLLGQPQQTRIQAGLSKIYLRENVYDWFAQDDFRVRANLTLNYGLRYEYFAPFTEINNRLVNLTGISTATTSVSCVTPTALSVQTSAGLLQCAASDSRSLLHPDRAMYAPRFGLAWSPKILPRLFKQSVVRTGYGINFNTGQFATFARSLSYQPPFAATENNLLTTSPNNPTGCSFANLTLASGFGCSTKLYQNSFAVNPDYRLGLVQVYNLDVQKTLPMGIVLNVGYNGSKGSNLDVTRAPNHTANFVTTPQAVAFTYEDSIAASHFNALTINARKRLQNGVALGATYQYAHSIDDASSFGGASSASSIQDDANLQAERSNSSFDVRHRVNGNWVYELPVGPNRRFLNKGGLLASAFDGFSLSGNFTFASGGYFTPSYQSTAGQIAAGGTYTLRPDRVLSQPLAGAGQLRSFFNRNAFVFPSSATGYGTASRYSIEGPGQVWVSAVLSRTVRFGDTRSFEGRMTATNVFNTVQYNGINTQLDSATFGQVTGAAAQRQITFTGRYRF